MAHLLPRPRPYRPRAITVLRGTREDDLQHPAGTRSGPARDTLRSVSHHLLSAGPSPGSLLIRRVCGTIELTKLLRRLRHRASPLAEPSFSPWTIHRSGGLWVETAEKFSAWDKPLGPWRSLAAGKQPAPRAGVDKSSGRRPGLQSFYNPDELTLVFLQGQRNSPEDPLLALSRGNREVPWPHLQFIFARRERKTG